MNYLLTAVVAIVSFFAGGIYGYFESERALKELHGAMHALAMKDSAEANIRKNELLFGFVRREDYSKMEEILIIDNETNNEIIAWANDICDNRKCNKHILPMFEDYSDAMDRDITSQGNNAPSAQD